MVGSCYETVCSCGYQGDLCVCVDYVFGTVISRDSACGDVGKPCVDRV